MNSHRLHKESGYMHITFLPGFCFSTWFQNYTLKAYCTVYCMYNEPQHFNFVTIKLPCTQRTHCTEGVQTKTHSASCYCMHAIIVHYVLVLLLHIVHEHGQHVVNHFYLCLGFVLNENVVI